MIIGATATSTAGVVAATASIVGVGVGRASVRTAVRHVASTAFVVAVVVGRAAMVVGRAAVVMVLSRPITIIVEPACCAGFDVSGPHLLIVAVCLVFLVASVEELDELLRRVGRGLMS